MNTARRDERPILIHPVGGAALHVETKRHKTRYRKTQEDVL